MNEARVRLHERLMESEEQIAHARYERGVSDDALLQAMDAADASLSPDERRENLYLSALSAYVQALGGHLELHAVFPDQIIVLDAHR